MCPHRKEKKYLKENHLLYILVQERQMFSEWLKLSEKEGRVVTRHKPWLQCTPILINKVGKYASSFWKDCQVLQHKVKKKKGQIG